MLLQQAMDHVRDEDVAVACCWSQQEHFCLCSLYWLFLFLLLHCTACLTPMKTQLCPAVYSSKKNLKTNPVGRGKKIWGHDAKMWAVCRNVASVWWMSISLVQSRRNPELISMGRAIWLVLVWMFRSYSSVWLVMDYVGSGCLMWEWSAGASAGAGGHILHWSLNPLSLSAAGRLGRFRIWKDIALEFIGGYILAEV